MSPTLAGALADNLALTRVEPVVATPLEVQLSERAGGMLLHISDLTFSSPTIPTAPVSSGSGSSGGSTGGGAIGHKKKKHKKKH